MTTPLLLGLGVTNMKQHPNYPEYSVTEEGEIYISFKNRLAKGEYRGNHAGLQFIGMVNLDTKEKELINVTELVAELYVPNPHGYRFVRHLNGIKFDNRPSNLVWVEKRDEIDAPTRKKEAWERGFKSQTLTPRQKIRWDKSHEALEDGVIYDC